MKFDFSKLRGRIVEKYGTCENFAAAVGTAKATMSGKLNNKVKITGQEIYKWSLPEFLDIAAEEIGVYFFTPLVR